MQTGCKIRFDFDNSFWSSGQDTTGSVDNAGKAENCDPTMRVERDQVITGDASQVEYYVYYSTLLALN